MAGTMVRISDGMVFGLPSGRESFEHSNGNALRGVPDVSAYPQGEPLREYRYPLYPLQGQS